MPEPTAASREETLEVDAVVVGAGFAGLYMLHRLRERGLRAVVLEAGSGVGGTWFWNRYPGARCDVESVDYSYSFDEELEQEWVWKERYATQPEILSYVNFVAERLDLLRDVRLETRVETASYDEPSATWRLTTSSGLRTSSRYLVMATGNLSVPATPSIPGVDSFEGRLLHTGHWPHEPVDLSGLRVGVIGTGSSGTQLIPVVAQQAEHLYVFQRTPNFSVPANNRDLEPGELEAIKQSYPSRRAAARLSPTGLNQRMNRESALEVTDEERLAVFEKYWNEAGFGFILAFSDLMSTPAANQTAVDFLHQRTFDLVDDPEVARALTATDYPFGSKRPCVDTGYYTTFNRDDVTLVDVRSHPLVEVTAHGVRTTEGEYELDALVLATGFEAMTGALRRIDIRGRDGVSLADTWAEGPSSYLGLGMAGFPNLLTITGPGSPSVLSNVLVSIEQHVEWIDRLLGYMLEHGYTSIEATEPAQAKWTEHVDDIAYATLYPVGATWYLGPEVEGKRRRFMPYAGGLRAYRATCEQVAADGYEGFALK
jgi:cation diffusion facilitator CzcD-associated flavoprotein CzcO